MKTVIRSRIVQFVFPAVLFFSGACATSQPPELDLARGAYSKAESNPQVVKYAPVILYDAMQALEKANHAEDEAAIKHYAYVTQETVKLAELTAEQKAAELEVEQLREKQQNVLMKVRQREAEKAREEALKAKAQLEQFQKQQQAEKLAEARKEVEQLERELAELKAKQTEKGLVLTLGDVLFKFNEADLMSGSMLIMDKLAEFLKSHPDRAVLIEGHTDSIGDETYNLELSQRRAEAVSVALRVRGIDADRITSRGLGEAYPIAGNDTDAGRQQNRRVEVTILDK